VQGRIPLIGKQNLRDATDYPAFTSFPLLELKYIASERMEVAITRLANSLLSKAIDRVVASTLNLPVTQSDLKIGKLLIHCRLTNSECAFYPTDC
jgi:hypothetical protein